MSRRVTAADIIVFFSGRKGFDWWWDDLDEDIQQEILDELDELLRTEQPSDG